MNNEVIKKLQIKNGKLQIQIERLKLDKEEYYLDYLNLQQRIDKAIKHIETHQLCYQSQYEEMSGFDNHLLDILRGEDNE